jgi:hypothetical protein
VTTAKQAIAIGMGTSVAGGFVANQLPQTAGNWKKRRLLRANTDVRKGGSPQGKEEPFLPAYTLERRKLAPKARRRIMRRRAVRSGVTGAALGGGAGLVIGGPKAAAASAALSGVGSAALAAASTPKSEWHMRRMHGVSARPTAPGQKPTIYVRGKDDVAKSALARVAFAQPNSVAYSGASEAGLTDASRYRKRIVRRRGKVAKGLPSALRPLTGPTPRGAITALAKKPGASSLEQSRRKTYVVERLRRQTEGTRAGRRLAEYGDEVGRKVNVNALIQPQPGMSRQAVLRRQTLGGIDEGKRARAGANAQLDRLAVKAGDARGKPTKEQQEAWRDINRFWSGPRIVHKSFGTDGLTALQQAPQQMKQKVRVLRQNVALSSPKKISAMKATRLGITPDRPAPAFVSKSDRSDASLAGQGVAGAGLVAAGFGNRIPEAGVRIGGKVAQVERNRFNRGVGSTGYIHEGRAAKGSDLSNTPPPRAQDRQGRPTGKRLPAPRKAARGEFTRRSEAMTARHKLWTTKPGLKGRSVAIVAPAAVGTGLLWHAARTKADQVDKRMSRDDVDRAAVGAMVGGAAYHVPSYGFEDPMRKKVWAKKIEASPSLKRINDQHAEKVKGLKIGERAWIEHNRTLPTALPGAKVRRIMARTHAGKSGMAATTGVAALAAAANVKQGRKRQAVSKAAPLNHREEVTADLTSNPKTNQAMVQRARAWKRQERSGRAPNKTAGPLVRARRVWREKTFTPLERKRFQRERAERDLKAVRNVKQHGDIGASKQNMSQAARDLADFDAGKRITPNDQRPGGKPVTLKLQYNGPGKAPSGRLKVA